MSLHKKISILLITIKTINSAFLEAESNFQKPLKERNNIVNKGIWVRDEKDRMVEQSNTGDFIFRANSMDVDNILQNNFDAFGDSDPQNSPGIFGYASRTKRATEHESKKLLQKNIKECKGDRDCILKRIADKSYVKSELISKLRPASVFNDYPYEVAIMLDDNHFDADSRRNAKDSDDKSVIPLNKNQISKFNIEHLVKNESHPETLTINNRNNTVIPKRSMKNEFESEILKKIEITESIDDNGTAKYDRGIFDKDERVWQQTIPDTTYKVNTKYPIKNKLINERGLIKVLSMLTKTFKKIMKQHNDIKKIHSKLHHINVDVNKNIQDINKKYQDIQEKYVAIMNVNDKIKNVESNINMKEEHMKSREVELAKNFAEFENQQKKFLTQQRQFYEIQQLMLAQNEKINLKQNVIAKTQSEISHRQNNFARILKKAKQIYADNKMSTIKSPPSTSKPVKVTEEMAKITHTTTASPYTTESIKINLFSIPALNKLVNQDIQILKEKDEQPVDDLVYKYYFNNTFIDNLMKSKILSTFVTTPENTEITRNTKSKRQKDSEETTILLPVNSGTISYNNLKRERRWIRHHRQTKAKLKKMNSDHVPNQFNDGKPLRPETQVVLQSKDENSATNLLGKEKNNPYMIMAKSFCNEIGHNKNAQMLDWCVEKSLRRLQFMDTKIPFLSPTIKMNSTTEHPGDKTTTILINKDIITPTDLRGSSLSPVTAPSTPLTIAPLVLQSTQADIVFFPDNDELESNLKNFDLNQDKEGNYYYDGSLQASDVGITDVSDGLSDIMPGLDSNSKVEVDPRTFDLQAKRRAHVRRINENIFKNVHG